MLNSSRAMNETQQLLFPSWPSFSDEEIKQVSKVLASGKVNYWTGNEGRLFEEEYAAALGARYAVALMNGTVALEAALAALEIGPGDEVITTCRTFIASASCIIARGATPVLVDVDPISQNITPATIKHRITPRTKAIIAVHLAGWACEMDAIMQLAKEYNLFVIEDCAQAHGGKFQNRALGTWGDVAAFSFCQDKIITTGGEGGMIITNNQNIWDKVWSLKDHGKSYKAVFEKNHRPGFRWVHESFGTNWRMTEIQAALGRIQLRKLSEWNQQRRQNAAHLTENFKKIRGLRVTEPSSAYYHAYYKYYVFIITKELKPDWNRDRILQAINDKGVSCFTGICSEIYLEKAFISSDYHYKTRLPVAQELGETSLMFLVHPTLTLEHMKYTVDVVKEIMDEAVY